MKKLRIAMVMSSNPAIAGGVQEHVLYLSAYLRKMGHTVNIFGPEGIDHRFTHYKSISTIIDIPIPGGTYTYINALKIPLDLSSVFSKKKFDLVHIHEPNIPSAAWTIIDQLKMPMVTTFHTAWDDVSILNLVNGVIPLFKEQFSRVVQAAIFVSSVTRARWKDICSSSVFQINIPNAVDTLSFKPKQSINTVPNILFVARLVSRKGVLHLLRALEIIKKDKIPFTATIIGDGKEKEDVLEFIKSHKLKKTVHYLGELKGSKRFKYFSAADVFCAPYVNEAAPLAILEAISAGLPIVGFINDSFKESCKGK
ncbi:MAG: glycosyltransferase family 4 protein [Candidatus Roizmanbacteria bacterium]|nr:glycosyltransferase family 4 protein [Candidatus Roizmanbacteria bacterium]